MDRPLTLPVMQSAFLAKVVERAESLGANRTEILQGSLLRNDVLDGPSTPVLCASVYLASTRAADLSGHGYICAELAQDYDWRTGFAVSEELGETPSLGDMLFAWLRFADSVQVSMQYTLFVAHDEARLSGRRFLSASQPPGQADAWDVASWVQMLRDLLGSTWDVSAIRASVAEPAAIPQRLVQSDRVSKSDAWGPSIAFPSVWLTRRTRQPDQAKSLAVLPPETSIDLVSLFETFDYVDWPGAERLAEFVGLHPKAMQRMLAVQETSSSELADIAKSRLAARWVSETDKPLKLIAQQLGYRNASAFTRACNRWFGCAPEQLRARS